VSNYIYQQTPNHDYGPDYADDTGRTGDCAVAIDAARSNVQGQAYNQIAEVLGQIIEAPNIQEIFSSANRPNSIYF
jgi:hypothetical protein